MRFQVPAFVSWLYEMFTFGKTGGRGSGELFGLCFPLFFVSLKFFHNKKFKKSETHRREQQSRVLSYNVRSCKQPTRPIAMAKSAMENGANTASRRTGQSCPRG